MDYEKKYKEALLEARAVLEPCLKYSRGKVREALDSIDKELKSFESEDERILRVISEAVITFFSDYANDFEDEDRDAALAWLEKQKEQKPEWSEEDVEAFIQKKLSGLTEFEEGLVTFYNKRNEIPSDKDGVYNKHELEEFLHESAKTLLALAKKELLSYADESNPAIEAMADLERTYFCNPDKLPKWLKDDIATKELNAHTKGYNKGYKDAEKQYNESVAYHFPIMPTTPVFGCDGIHCTNPQMDCINCPRRTTGGSFSTSSASGTSTLKAEE